MMDKIQAMMLVGESILTKEDFDKINNDVLVPQEQALNAQFYGMSASLNMTIKRSYDIDFSSEDIRYKVSSVLELGRKVEAAKKSWDDAIAAEKAALAVATAHQKDLEVDPCSTARLVALEAKDVASFLAQCNVTFIALASNFSKKWAQWDDLRPLTTEAKGNFESVRTDFKKSFCSEFAIISGLIDAYDKDWATAQSSTQTAVTQAEATHTQIQSEDTGIGVIRCLLKALQADLSADEVASQSEKCMAEAKTNIPRLAYPTAFTKVNTSGSVAEMQLIWSNYSYQEGQQSSLEACQAAATGTV